MQAAARPEFVWESPDQATEIHLDLDVVDGILHECMRGLGAVPKRGAEVGGVLLGTTAQDGSVWRVKIEAFEAVVIEYRHGPSYLLSEADDQLFDRTMMRLRSAEPLRPVGFYRSNTREEMVLTAEDTRLLDRYFPEPGAVVLMTRPYATKLSVAGLFLRQEGSFVPGVPPENQFPFRRKELLEEIGQDEVKPTGARVPYRPFAVPEPDPAPAPAPAMAAPVERVRAIAPTPAPSPPAPAPIPLAGAVARRGTRWVWVPLSFIFLVVGVLLGFQAALSVRGTPTDPYGLGMSVERSGDTVMLRWNRGAPAIRAAGRGTIFIEDGEIRKSRALQADELQNGSVVYPPSGNLVRFRLEVFPTERDSVSETIDWRR